jgi:hypothetical protein
VSGRPYTDVYVIVEGLTEEAFVVNLLLEHLIGFGVRAEPILTGTRKSRRAHKGGHRNTYQVIRDDIARTLDQHANRQACVTTMLDLYALPDDFPGFSTSAEMSDPYTRVASIEAAMAESFPEHLHRFRPHIQLHEFEALLLCEPDMIARRFPDQVEAVELLAAEVGEFDGPEWVNDGPATAPSKRLERHIAGYDKVLHGSLLAHDIGLDVMREHCPHFAQWLGSLEALG